MPVPSTKDAELVKFFRTGRQQKYRKGEIILRAGDTPQGIYWIESGWVKIFALDKHGVEHTHLFYQKSDIFPMIWAFKDAIRNVYYEAFDDTVVWLVPKNEFKKFLESHAESAVYMLEHAVNMFRLYAGRIDNLLYSSAFERTVYRLISLLDRLGERKPDGSWIVDVPITHQDLASSVNLSRETVSRCMERLRRKGIIGPNVDKMLHVNDLPALIHIIGEDEVVGMWPEFAKYLPKQ